MKKPRRLWFYFVLSCLLILGGCARGSYETSESNSGGSGTTTETSSQDQSSASGDEETDVDQTSVSSSNEDATEITVWAWDDSFNGEAMRQAQAIYGDSVKINFVEMSKADCLKKIHTYLASGVTDGLPEIVAISDLAAQGYLMSYPGAFMPMDDVIDYDDFAAYKKAQVSYDGVGYGVPFDTGVAGLFYRRDYMEEIGYSEEDMQNLTWDEYLSLGEKLKEKGHLLQTYNPNDIAEFQIMLQSAGTWFTDGDGNADFSENEALKQCYDIFKQLNDSDYCKVISDWTGFVGAINGGDVACVMRGSWISSSIMQAEDQSGEWGVAPIPTMDIDGATQYSNQGGSSWYVLANSANADVAADFLKNTFASSTDLYNTLLADNIMGTYLPAKDVAAYQEAQEYYGGQKVNADLAAWLEEIPAVDVGAYSTEAQTALLGVTPDILNGADLDQSLKTAEEQYEQLIQ